MGEPRASRPDPGDNATLRRRLVGMTLLLMVLLACGPPLTGPGGRPAATVALEADLEPTPPPPDGRLELIRHWLYLIDVNLTPNTVDMIEASDHDLVVLDFIPSEANNTDFPMAEVVRRLHDAAHPKLVNDDPPGDCPLPRTEAMVEAPAYVRGLSAACRDLYERFPDSTLHVSSDSYLHFLQLAQSKGTFILTVDYAVEPDNVAWIYATSRSLGFIPFVGNRALDRYRPPVP